jgi:hypothetical protein
VTPFYLVQESEELDYQHRIIKPAGCCVTSVFVLLHFICFVSRIDIVIGDSSRVMGGALAGIRSSVSTYSKVRKHAA